MKPFFSRVGGKCRLVKTIIPLIPEHKIYVEPFVGAGNILFNKHKVVENHINDLDKTVYDFFHLLKNHGNKLDTKFLSNTVYCNKQMFDYFRDNLSSLKNEKKLEAMIYLNKISYRGNGENYAQCIVDYPGGYGSKRFIKNLDKMLEFMSDITITNVDYKDCIIQYLQKEDAFIFIDPPYSYCENYKSYYNVDYLVSPKEIADILKGCKCKFMITYDDSEFIRECFKDYTIIETRVKYTSSKKNIKPNKEVIIKNY